MSGPIEIRFLKSFATVDDMPTTDAEVAVVGRSNVGKSSLINALANRHDLAKTSKTPGATRLLNVFEVGRRDSRRWLVDLPGYGYAKRSKAEQARWAEMIDRYLTERPGLSSVLHLIDGEVGPTASDLQTRDWLMHIGLEPAYVATKSDKVRASRRGKRRSDLVGALGVDRGEVSWVSASKGTGVPELRTRVARLLEVV